MILVVKRHGSNTIVGQEFTLVQHLLQDSHQSLLGTQSQQLSITTTGNLDVGNVSLRNLGPVLDEPVHSLLETGESFDDVGFQCQGGVQGYETDHGPNRELLRVTSAPCDGVIVESVLLVPERHLFVATSATGERHGVGDEQEVFEELGRNVLVGGVVLGQFESNVQHVQGKEGHPGGAVGLSEGSSGR